MVNNKTIWQYIDSLENVGYRVNHDTRTGHYVLYDEIDDKVEGKFYVLRGTYRTFDDLYHATGGNKGGK